MTRTPVKTADVTAAIVTAINGATVNGGTMSAVAQPGNHAITIKSHTDAPGASFNYTWDLLLR